MLFHKRLQTERLILAKMNSCCITDLEIRSAVNVQFEKWPITLQEAASFL